MGRKKNSKRDSLNMAAFADSANYFNASNQIDKYHLDHSTFDLMDVDRFHNTDSSTVFSYVLTWILMILSWVLLGVDIYTCVNILVLHNWSNDTYKPYAYSVAKWIFTGCIIFQFALLLYHWIWAIHTYRTRNIALAYVNKITRLLFIVRSYNYHCLFHKIEQDNFFDWACFLTYTELDNFLQIVVADTPRQVINILTLANYATNNNLSNDIIRNIKDIADTNIMLSIVLSFMLLSVAIWSIFFLKFVFGMIMYIPIKSKLRKKKFKSLKKYCCSVVNDNVRTLVFTHHKPKNELLEKGILDLKGINANPLLSSSTTTFGNFDDSSIAGDGKRKISPAYRGILPSSTSTASLTLSSQNKPAPSIKSSQSYRYNDNNKLYNIAVTGNITKNNSFEYLPLNDLHGEHGTQPTMPRSTSNLNQVYTNSNSSLHSLYNPFNDYNQSMETLTQPPPKASKAQRKPPPSNESTLFNPFQDPPRPYLADKRVNSKESMNTVNTSAFTLDQDSSYMTQSSMAQQQQHQQYSVPPASLADYRNPSQSSLTYDEPTLPRPAPSIPRSTTMTSNEYSDSPFEYEYHPVMPSQSGLGFAPLSQPQSQQQFPPRSTSISSSEFHESSNLLHQSSSLHSLLHNDDSGHHSFESQVRNPIMPRSESQASELSYPTTDIPLDSTYEFNDFNKRDDNETIDSPGTIKQYSSPETYTHNPNLDHVTKKEIDIVSKSDSRSDSSEDFIHPIPVTKVSPASDATKSTPYPLPESDDEDSSLESGKDNVAAPYPVRGVSMFGPEEVDENDRHQLGKSSR